MMHRTFSLILVLILAFFSHSLAKKSQTRRLKKLEQMDRDDEYANSLRRRNYFKDRLVLQMGAGSKFFAMGEKGVAIGVGAEYITKWGLAPFATYGIVPKTSSEHFLPNGESNGKKEGGNGYKLGLAYYLFPKIPMHLGFSLSYGKNFYDHVGTPTAEVSNLRVVDLGQATERTVGDTTNVERILFNSGYQADMTITYLSDSWYYLTINVGMAYSGNALPGTANNSRELNEQGVAKAIVTPESALLKDLTLVYGIGIGFALPDLFPDNTEIRRRERAKERKKMGR